MKLQQAVRIGSKNIFSEMVFKLLKNNWMIYGQNLDVKYFFKNESWYSRMDRVKFVEDSL